MYQPGDLADIDAVFRARNLGLDPDVYPLPDFSDPIVRSNIVTRTDDGKFIACAYTRALVEVGLVFDPWVATNKERMHALWALHYGTMRDLQDKGYDRAIAFLAPKPEGFGEILERHGWAEEKERRLFTFDF